MAPAWAGCEADVMLRRLPVIAGVIVCSAVIAGCGGSSSLDGPEPEPMPSVQYPPAPENSTAPDTEPSAEPTPDPIEPDAPEAPEQPSPAEPKRTGPKPQPKNIKATVLTVKQADGKPLAGAFVLVAPEGVVPDGGQIRRKKAVSLGSQLEQLPAGGTVKVTKVQGPSDVCIAGFKRKDRLVYEAGCARVSLDGSDVTLTYGDAGMTAVG